MHQLANTGFNEELAASIELLGLEPRGTWHEDITFAKSRDGLSVGVDWQGDLPKEIQEQLSEIGFAYAQARKAKDFASADSLKLKAAVAGVLIVATSGTSAQVSVKADFDPSKLGGS
jgi:hypothetical protein